MCRQGSALLKSHSKRCTTSPQNSRVLYNPSLYFSSAHSDDPPKKTADDSADASQDDANAKNVGGASPLSSGTNKSDNTRSPLTAIIQSDEVEVTSRGIGQVIFLNSVDSGRVIFVSLAYADPTLASMAALGSFTATATSKFIGLDKNTWKDGLWSYNGALIGCAASVFGPSYMPYMVASTLMGAAATPVLSASLKSTLSQPQWTWSFNIVALTSLLRTRPLLESASSDGEDIVQISTGLADIASSPLVGMSQIFVVDSKMTGAGILAATYMYSPKLAMHALGGSATGCLVGLLSGADLSNVCMGLWGYNSALASMAVGTFFVHSRQSMILSVTSAAGAAAVFGAMQTLFGTFGAPCLTLPFCSVASACYLLEGHIPGLKLAAEPHSPEKNA